MNRKQANIIIDHILANNNADLDSGIFVPLKTSTTIGYIPRSIVGYFAEVEGFAMSPAGKLRFSENAHDFESKCNAIRNVCDVLLQYQAIKPRNDSWGYEGRYVGGENRLSQPEFEIDRQYFQYFGFEADAAFLELRTNIDGQDFILLQQRSASVIKEGQFSFTASGATKVPARDNRKSIMDQINHEISPDYKHLTNEAVETAQVLRCKLQDKNKPVGSKLSTVFNIRTQLYSLSISQETAEGIMKVQNEEASGYQLATPQDIIQYCLDGTIDPMLTQSYMASLISTGLMPQSEFVSEIKVALEEKGGCVFADRPSGTKMRPAPRP